MFTKKTPTPEIRALDELIKSVYSDLAGFTSDTEEFEASSARLKELLELQASLAPKTVSPDVVLTVAANLLGIIAILGYEHGHVITSKALQFVMKLR